MSDENVVDIRGLTKVFGPTKALDAVDLCVPRGSIFGFLGRNGAGKTTTLRILTGLARPTSGHAAIFGHDVVHQTNAVRAQVGFLPDVPGFYGWMTGREFLVFAGQLFGIERSTLDERVHALLDMVGLKDVRARIAGYSRGMKQRLGLAQALINAPQLLLLDEPTSALDPIGRKEVLEMIASLAGRTTVLFSTHILADVERVCDHVAILDRGRVVTQSTTQELKRHGSATRIAIEVAGDIDAVSNNLQGETSIRQVEREANRLILTANDLEAARKAIPAAVAAAQAGLRTLQTIEASLEEVFVQLVGSQPEAPSYPTSSTPASVPATAATVQAGRDRSGSGFPAFLRNELRGILKTWRVWVLPGMIGFFAITSPIIALLTPALVQSLAGSQPGLVIEIPEPTAVDAYQQFLKNLTQIVLIAIVITGAGSVASEHRAGTLALVLTKPLSRAGFIVGKIVSQLLLVLVACALGALLCMLMTTLLFEGASVRPLARASGLWLIQAGWMIVVMTLLSALLGSQGAAAGLGLVVYFVLAVLGAWAPTATYTNAGLTTSASKVLALADVQVVWPVLFAAVSAALLSLLAIASFQRKEL